MVNRREAVLCEILHKVSSDPFRVLSDSLAQSLQFPSVWLY